MKRLIGLTTLGNLALQPRAIAQIASPLNAGLNSGAGSFGSTTTSVATPNFSRAPVPLMSGLAVESDGTIIATPEQLRAVEEAICSALSQPESQILSPVLEVSRSFSGVQLVSLDLSQPLIPSTGSASTAASTGSGTDQRVAISSDLTNQLVALVGNLSRQANLNQLSAAINFFNQVIRQSSPSVLSSLRRNPVFLAISSTLRSTRTALEQGR